MRITCDLCLYNDQCKQAGKNKKACGYLYPLPQYEHLFTTKDYVFVPVKKEGVDHKQEL